MDLNKVILVGRLARDVELRVTPNGNSVASFAIATNRVWNDKSGQKQEEADFHNIVVWGRQAELCNQYLTKGSTVLIEGRLRTRSWVAPTGEKKYRTEVISERVQFGPRPQGAMQQERPMTMPQPAASPTQQTPAIEEQEEVLPEITQDQIPVDDAPPF